MSHGTISTLMLIVSISDCSFTSVFTVTSLDHRSSDLLVEAALQGRASRDCKKHKRYEREQQRRQEGRQRER